MGADSKATPQFTPGPWVKRGRYVEAANGHVCEVGRSGDKKLDEADAHLIAAAPELYEAVEGVTELLVATVTEFGCWTANDHPKVQAARTALAKARGQSDGR